MIRTPQWHRALDNRGWGDAALAGPEFEEFIRTEQERVTQVLDRCDRLIGLAMLLVLNLPLVRLWARLLTISACGIYAGVLVFAALGCYAAGGTTADLLLLCGSGLLGLLMRQAEVPVAPAVVGLISCPLAEQQLRRALTISGGDPAVLVSAPLPAALWGVALLLAVGAPLVRRRRAVAGRSPIGRRRERGARWPGRRSSEHDQLLLRCVLICPRIVLRWGQSRYSTT